MNAKVSFRTVTAAALGVALLAALPTGCSSKKKEAIKDPFGVRYYTDAERKAGNGAAMVNGLLWRASLESLSYMPLASADPVGGVILTEWFSHAKSPAERVKVAVYILDRQLRADALKVSVYRQQQDDSGAWRDAAVTPETVDKLTDAILTKARQYRIQAIEGK